MPLPGVLGPTLKEIEYETRKAKKRRIEYEEVQRNTKQIRKGHSSSAKVISPTVEGIPPISDSSKDRIVSTSGGLPKAENEFPIRIQGQPKIQQHYSNGDACSVASETSLSYTHVKMSLFPLYVTEIRDKWPEQGRFRKVVDIDEAIRMTETRPEFQEALKELKQRNLHNIPKSIINTSLITDMKKR